LTQQQESIHSLLTSLHLVLPTKFTLLRHLTAVAADNAIISQLKQHLQEKLGKYFTVSDIHAAATTSDARLKIKLNLFSAEVSNRAMHTICKTLDIQVQTEDELSTAVGSEEPATKRAKLA